MHNKHEPTETDRAWVRIAAAGAMPQEDICRRMGIAPGTLRKHYRAELNSALPDLTVRVHANFLRIATGDSRSAAWAAERWLRMRAPEQWRDQPTEIANAGGAPFAVSFRWADAPPQKLFPTEPETETDASTEPDAEP